MSFTHVETQVIVKGFQMISSDFCSSLLVVLFSRNKLMTLLEINHFTTQPQHHGDRSLCLKVITPLICTFHCFSINRVHWVHRPAVWVRGGVWDPERVTWLPFPLSCPPDDHGASVEPHPPFPIPPSISTPIAPYCALQVPQINTHIKHKSVTITQKILTYTHTHTHK